VSNEFASWQSYWYFVHSVRSEYRYLHEFEAQQFLDAVRATTPKRVLSIQAGSLVWRAQLGTDSVTTTHEDEETGVAMPIDEDAPFRPDRMKPVENRALEGRVNPKGIPCLYLSSDPDTAMAEVRPWLGAPISLGQFEIVRNLNLVDCSASPSNHMLYLGDAEPSPVVREAAVWGDIDEAFSSPVTAADDHAEYAPTQILAEVFRQAGYDGVAYRSSCASGKNYVLFRLDDAELRSCHLKAAKELKYSFQQIANPYFLNGGAE